MADNTIWKKYIIRAHSATSNASRAVQIKRKYVEWVQGIC